MDFEIKDYILRQDKVVSKEWCDQIIDFFKGVKSVSRSKSLGISPLKQDNKIPTLISSVISTEDPLLQNLYVIVVLS